MSDERIKDLYAVASEYNLLILEDDPYYYLNYRQTEVSKKVSETLHYIFNLRKSWKLISPLS